MRGGSGAGPGTDADVEGAGAGALEPGARPRVAADEPAGAVEGPGVGLVEEETSSLRSLEGGPGRGLGFFLGVEDKCSGEAKIFKGNVKSI